jgi:hypothetical protein
MSEESYEYYYKLSFDAGRNHPDDVPIAVLSWRIPFNAKDDEDANKIVDKIKIKLNDFIKELNEVIK